MILSARSPSPNPAAGGPGDGISRGPDIVKNVFGASGLKKRFWSTQALDGVSLSVEAGQVLGLVGENGAGKSTLLNILSGCARPDAGVVSLCGKTIEPKTYHEANEMGIFRIFQELSLIPNLPVYENVFLSHERHFSKFGVLNKKQMADRAAALFEEFEHGWIDVRRPARSYDFATRQAIEIVKTFALARLLQVDVPVLLLDEPTAALSRSEIDGFFRLIAAMRDRAITVFVSHRLTEVLEISDKLLVLKDGRAVAECAKQGVGEPELHEMMVGRLRDEQFYKERDQLEPAEQVRLRLSGLGGPGFAGIDLSVRASEIVGVAGVIGAGKAELARSIAGIAPVHRGAVEVDGVVVERPCLDAALKRGIGYVTPDRGDEGIFGGLPVAWNISIARLAASRGFLLEMEKEQREADHYIKRLRVKTEGASAAARTLSGGNQQKLLMARWLAFDVKVLILDNPTRGVDAGAKEEIYGLLRTLSKAGVAILLVSDDLLEVIGLSNRILVMKDGAVAQEMASPLGGKPSEAELVAAMV